MHGYIDDGTIHPSHCSDGGLLALAYTLHSVATNGVYVFALILRAVLLYLLRFRPRVGTEMKRCCLFAMATACSLPERQKKQNKHLIPFTAEQRLRPRVVESSDLVVTRWF